MLSRHPIFIIFVVAVAAPLLAQLRAISWVPTVVIEVLLGMAIGPRYLHMVEYDSFL